MKIAYTSDIHIDSSKENAMIPQEILYQLKKNTPDVFIITGDISHSLKIIEQTLSAFRALSCMKLFVPGNHDIWIETDCPNSYTKYFKILPRVAKENGFIPIWIEPYILDTYGFCGSMGWYDYSFRDRNLNLPEEVYAEKRYKGHTWMDREYARFIIKEKLLTDKEITQIL